MKTGIKENFSLHCVQKGQKQEKKKLNVRETPIECSNGSEASEERHPFVERPEESPEQSLPFFNEKAVTVGLFFYKQNDRVAKFGSDVSEHCTMSTTNHLVLIMFGFVALNRESAVYKEY